MKHISQKEALANIDHIKQLEQTIDVFFDRYNESRNSMYIFLDDLIDVSSKAMNRMGGEISDSDDEIKKKIDLEHPEFLVNRDEWIRLQERERIMKHVRDKLLKLFPKNQKPKTDNKK